MNTRQNSPQLELDELKVMLARRLVLDIEHLGIGSGEIVLLAGANGSGKTTLLKVLAGLLTPQEARFKCLGVNMARRTAARFCRGRHIYLHQTPFMFDGSVEENVGYGLRQRRRDVMQRRIEIRDALAWAQLEHLVHRRANELSVGEQQRVALTRARILAPSLLLLDEITANMDADSRKRTYEMIVDLRRAGSSIVFASHDHEPIEAICDVYFELNHGRILETEPVEPSVVPLRRGRSHTRES